MINVSLIKWIVSSCATRGGRFDPTNHMIQGNPTDTFTIRLKKSLSRCLGVHEFHINITMFHGNLIDNTEIQIVVTFASIIWTTCDIIKIHSIGINNIVVNIGVTPWNKNHPHATPFRNKLVMIIGTFDTFSFYKSRFKDSCNLFDSLRVNIEWCYTRDILAVKFKNLIRC